MATIKLEILLDSNTDQNAFANLMHVFSGTPSVQVLSEGSFPLEALKRTIEAQSPSQNVSELQDKGSTVTDYTEAEMMKLPNSELKEYATSLGIEWAKAEGKNTNRKLTDLILAFRERVAVPGEDQEDSAETEEDSAETEEDSAETEEDLAEEKEENLEGVDYNDLKIALAKKVEDHRPAIVAKLSEFGATKMPNLPKEHWEEMYNFLESL